MYTYSVGQLFLPVFFGFVLDIFTEILGYKKAYFEVR